MKDGIFRRDSREAEEAHRELARNFWKAQGQTENKNQVPQETREDGKPGAREQKRNTGFVDVGGEFPRTHKD